MYTYEYSHKTNLLVQIDFNLKLNLIIIIMVRIVLNYLFFNEVIVKKIKDKRCILLYYNSVM